MAAEVLPVFKKDIEELVLVPSDGGRFELFVDDEQVYSKLETGRFPENRDVIKKLDARLKN